MTHGVVSIARDPGTRSLPARRLVGRSALERLSSRRGHRSTSSSRDRQATVPVTCSSWPGPGAHGRGWSSRAPGRRSRRCPRPSASSRAVRTVGRSSSPAAPTSEGSLCRARARGPCRARVGRAPDPPDRGTDRRAPRQRRAERRPALRGVRRTTSLVPRRGLLASLPVDARGAAFQPGQLHGRARVQLPLERDRRVPLFRVPVPRGRARPRCSGSAAPGRGARAQPADAEVRLRGGGRPRAGLPDRAMDARVRVVQEPRRAVRGRGAHPRITPRTAGTRSRPCSRPAPRSAG